MKAPYFILILLLGAACGTPEVQEVELPALRASGLFDSDKVADYIRDHGDKHKDVALTYYKKAKDLAGTDKIRALYHFKRALTLWPNEDGYRQLGDFLMENRMFAEAEELYGLLESSAYAEGRMDEYFDRPDIDVYYNYIVATAYASNYAPAIRIMEAEEAGFSRSDLRKMLDNDKRLAADTASLSWRSLQMQFWTQEEREQFVNSPQNFNEFIHHFKDTTSVFAINRENVAKFKYSNDDGFSEYEGLMFTDFFKYFMEEYRNEEYFPEYNFTHRWTIGDSVYAVVYAIDTSARGAPYEFRQVYHRLVLFDKAGKQLQSKVIAGQSGDKLSTVVVNGADIQITDHTRVWKQPYSPKDFDNEVMDIVQDGHHILHITPSGEITYPDEP